MGYYVLADDEDGRFVATVKLPSEERAIEVANGFIESPSMDHFEIVKVVRHIEKPAAAGQGESPVSSPNSDYAAALRAHDEYHDLDEEYKDKWSFRTWLVTRLNSAKAPNCA